MNGLNGWRNNRPILNHIQGIIDFLILLLKIIIYVFIICVTARLLWFILSRVF